MRVNFKHVFYGLMAVAATVVGTSCSSNNDNNGREETLTDIHPTKVFKGGLPKKALGADVTTDKFGRVVKFVSAPNFNEVTFEYMDKQASRVEKRPNVVMTVIDDGVKDTFDLYLNKDRFVSYCEHKYTHKGKTSLGAWRLSYDEEGRLLNVETNEPEEQTTRIQYKEGDIVSTTTTTKGAHSHSTTTNIDYLRPGLSPPYENKGCVMFFGLMFNIDLGDLEFAYWAGLLGHATRHLPVQAKTDNDTADQFTWSFYENNYPKQLSYEDDGTVTVPFVW